MHQVEDRQAGRTSGIISATEAARINRLLTGQPQPHIDPELDRSESPPRAFSPASSTRIHGVKSLMVMTIMGCIAVGLLKALGML
jgi:hypothetical protein